VHRRNINVYNVGLSNFDGSLTLHIPKIGSQIVNGLGSFRTMQGTNYCIEVPVHRLDYYEFHDVSFIKIDVEGHESKVLEGGCKTLLREKPLLLIEIEQRHLDDQSIEMVFKQILEFGYEGNFLYKDKLFPLSDFSYKKNQELFLNNVYSEDYIKNFIFQPSSKKSCTKFR
jgi:hypothetical protein